MKTKTTLLMLIAILIAVVHAERAASVTLPEGYMPLAESQPVVDKILRAHLTPDVSTLTPRERATVDKLMQVGRVFEDLYEVQRYPNALSARAQLYALDKRLGSPAETANLVTLYYMNRGPVARMLDNQRRPFVPMKTPPPGGSLYPVDATKAEIDAFLAAHPETRDDILGPRTAVRRADRASLTRDISTLRTYPVLNGLNLGLRASLEEKLKAPNPAAFYAVPYAVAFPKPLLDSYALLTDASREIAPEDADFALYLRNRARDLITNDYESGDATWVTGRFKTLNAQIGSYENYDDELYGAKTYFALSILKIDRERSDALRAATSQIQTLENSLPYDEGKPHKRVRSDIPVGVYDVLADFGQSRSANTASILPNDSGPARRYGRTILLRRNIMESPEIFDASRATYASVMENRFVSSLTPKGGSDRTLWHEIGHYLGVDRTRDGVDLDIALEQASSIYEEMKADLVSLFVAPGLEKLGYYTDADMSPLYASGVRRVLLKNKPDRSQVYQTMELMQFNYFMAHGVLSFDTSSGRLAVHEDKFHDAVAAMLRDVLEIQAAGDAKAAEAYITKWSEWRDDLHERLAEAMRKSEKYRFTCVTFDLLDAPDGAPHGTGRAASSP
ncbi:MAG TPA: NUDIX hydrolase [Candidatus Krumholzibacteria bacterium]|nr:NUDIX hydrolase [Candidatus Krumholzibacteria bacterium]